MPARDALERCPHRVYVIEGPGGIYVGCTSRGIEDRWQGHLVAARTGSSLPLHQSMRAHGSDAFTVSLLAEAPGRAAGRDIERATIEALVRDGKPLFNRHMNRTVRIPRNTGLALTVRLPKSMIRQIGRRALRTKQNRSNAVRELLERALDAESIR